MSDHWEALEDLQRQLSTANRKLQRISIILANPLGNHPTLTPRETLVGKMASRGWQTPEICKDIHVSASSVGQTMAAITRKTGLAKRELTGELIRRIELTLTRQDLE